MAVFLGCTRTGRVGFCPGTPGGSTGSGSGFKASQKTGHPEGSTESGFVEKQPGIDNTFKNFDFQCTF